MIQFAITNLQIDQESFKVPSVLGEWEFVRAPNYNDHVPKIQEGMCANTFYAESTAIDATSSNTEFETASDEIVDICMVLSFLNACCVTPSGTTA